MVKDRTLMQKRFGTSVLLFGAFWLWVQVFASAPLFVQILAVSLLEPMLLAVVCGLIAWAQHDAGRITALVVPLTLLIAWVIWVETKHVSKVEPVMDVDAVHPVAGEGNVDENNGAEEYSEGDGPLDQPAKQRHIPAVAVTSPEADAGRDKDDNYDDDYDDDDDYDYDYNDDENDDSDDDDAYYESNMSYESGDRNNASVIMNSSIPEAALVQMAELIRDRICAELKEIYGDIIDNEASGLAEDERRVKGKKTKQRGITSEEYVSLFEKQFNEEFIMAKKRWKATQLDGVSHDKEEEDDEDRRITSRNADAAAKLIMSISGGGSGSGSGSANVASKLNRSSSGSGSGVDSYSDEGGVFISGSSSMGGSRDRGVADDEDDNDSRFNGPPPLPTFLVKAKEQIYDELVAEFGNPRRGPGGAATKAEGVGQSSGGCSITTDEFMRLFEERFDAAIVAFVRGGDSDDSTSSSDFITQEFARMDAERMSGATK